jgi:hypothetical protein
MPEKYFLADAKKAEVVLENIWFFFHTKTERLVSFGSSGINLKSSKRLQRFIQRATPKFFSTMTAALLIRL